MASVNLPNGAYISTMTMYGCVAPGSEMWAELHQSTLQEGGYPTDSGAAMVAMWNPLTNMHCGFASPSYVQVGVRAGFAYHLVVKTTHPEDFVELVVLNVEREMSPAPTVASFDDVPLQHWAFRSIEALRAAGITNGCTASTYCPEQFVTRAEMATFLNRALGLYWP